MQFRCVQFRKCPGITVLSLWHHISTEAFQIADNSRLYRQERGHQHSVSLTLCEKNQPVSSQGISNMKSERLHVVISHSRPHPLVSGLLIRRRTDVLPQDRVKSWSREIGSYDDRIALKFDRHLGSAAAECLSNFRAIKKCNSEARGFETSQDLLVHVHPLGEKTAGYRSVTICERFILKDLQAFSFIDEICRKQ